MALHREGKKTVVVVVSGALVLCALIGVLLILSGWNYTLRSILIALVAIGLIFVCWFVGNFFRIEKRVCAAEPAHCYSPADGRVVAIERVYEPEVLKREVQVVSIFMSVWNVHFNHYPVSGVVEYVRHHHGKFLVAWHPKSSTENERTTVVVRTPEGEAVLFRQIAGAVARRISCYAQEGETVTAGAELGFIKFGSRVDIFLPLEATLCVELGEKVRVSETLLAKL